MFLVTFEYELTPGRGRPVVDSEHPDVISIIQARAGSQLIPCFEHPSTFVVMFAGSFEECRAWLRQDRGHE